MSNISLDPYKGPWEKKNAIHLLNRALLGYRIDEVNESSKLGLDKTLDKLLETLPLPSPPVHYTYDQDPNAPIGTSWVMHKAPIPAPAGLNFNRRRSLRAWQMGLFNEEGMNIREKMVLFWHDHLPISAETNARYQFQYINTLRTHALGNFRDLIVDITVSPAMLRYLNGGENDKDAPNENYSRELLELFTVGRGLEQGNGDYTNYTEDDVLELARALTGWRVTNEDGLLPYGRFVARLHDEGQKSLSARLGNQVINNAGEEEYKNVVDAIFKSDEVARFISRKLYIWFLDSDISSEIESQIIKPMANIIIEDNYEIKGALRALLASQHFNNVSKHGCMISSPLDFMFKVMNTLDIELDLDFDAKYFFWDKLYEASIALDMVMFDLPSVAGWQAYYQSPQYYNYWINSYTLIARQDYLTALESGVSISGEKYGLDYFRIISKVENPSNPNTLIQEMIDQIFTVPISENQFSHLKRGLLGDDDDSTWTTLYNDYVNNPDNTSLKRSVEEKLFVFFWRFMRMPEFQLM